MTTKTVQLVLEGSQVSMLIGQQGSLIRTTEHLANLWRSTPDESTKSFLAIATTLTAHAACEAILNEWAYKHAADYKKSVRAPLWSRAVDLFKQLSDAHATQPPVTPPDDLRRLSEAKNAMAHSEPDNTRSGEVGNWVAGDGAERSLKVVKELTATFG